MLNKNNCQTKIVCNRNDLRQLFIFFTIVIFIHNNVIN